MNYSLRFTFDPVVSDNLEIGLLELIKDDSVINLIRTTSSFKGMQYWGSWQKKGGLIPPGEWEVSTNPIDMAWNKGVNTGKKNIPSFFYQIFPEIQRQANGILRGDFGIHFDGNAPGSAGCIVAVTFLGWQRIREFMAAANKAGFDRIKIVVVYNK